MKKPITLLLILFLLLTACRSATAEVTEPAAADAGVTETETAPTEAGTEKTAAPPVYEFSEELFTLQLMDLVPLVYTPDQNEIMPVEAVRALQEAYTEKAKGIGVQAQLDIPESIIHRDAYKLAHDGITALFAEQEAGGKGAFYKVENKGNTVWLFGSIHIGDASMYPIEARRMNAFHEADELHVELDLQDRELMAELQSFQLRKDGKTLQEDLGDERFNRFIQVMADHGMPVDPVMLKPLKSWTVLHTLSLLPVLADDPYSAIRGVDQYFLTLAHAEGKPVHSLETVETQLGLMENLYGDNEARLFEQIDEALDIMSSEEEVQKQIEEIRTLRAAWAEGDPDKIEAVALAGNPKETAVLTEERDPQMTEKIIEILESNEKKSYFVVVGAAHYVPENSIIGLLKEAGYTVEDLNE